MARWLILAWLLATLAPGISRMLTADESPNAQAGKTWVELCTDTGVQWVRLDLQSPTDDAVPGHESLDRCAHCTLATERFAPLRSGLPALPSALGEPVTPPLMGVLFTADSTTRPGARGPPMPIG